TMPQIEHGFSPYADNGGSVLAIAGEDFCVVAADTRQSDGYSINSRYSPKAYKLSDKVILGTSGFHADGSQLTKRVKQQMDWYKYKHNKAISCPATAQMLSNMLYMRRFFPYYTFNIVGGLDPEGRGAVYSFDPVGSFEREEYRSGGSAADLLQPFLDSQVRGKRGA
ncbi:nucleophile aminohydrolase, partial [Piptocephalis cylindrospora]